MQQQMHESYMKDRSISNTAAGEKKKDECVSGNLGMPGWDQRNSGVAQPPSWPPTEPLQHMAENEP
jgi:hypothetical protein